MGAGNQTQELCKRLKSFSLLSQLSSPWKLIFNRIFTYLLTTSYIYMIYNIFWSYLPLQPPFRTPKHVLLPLSCLHVCVNIYYTCKVYINIYTYISDLAHCKVHTIHQVQLVLSICEWVWDHFHFDFHFPRSHQTSKSSSARGDTSWPIPTSLLEVCLSSSYMGPMRVTASAEFMHETVSYFETHIPQHLYLLWHLDFSALLFTLLPEPGGGDIRVTNCFLIGKSEKYWKSGQKP